MKTKRIHTRIIQFQVVAWGGTLVNLGVLWLTKGVLGVPLIPAGILAIETAIIHNFTWHYFITWKERVAGTPRDYFARLVRYNLITASIDFTVNLGILWGLTTFAGVHYLIADILGMLAGPFFKFLTNEFLIFKRERHGEWREKSEARD